MFLKGTFSKFNYSGQATGIEATFLRNNQVVFNLVRAKKNNDAFEILEDILEIDSTENLNEKIKGNEPTILTISGNGVLHRKMEFTGQESLIEAFNRLFPHSNFKEFYIQIWQAQDNKVGYLSIIRKDQIDILLEKLQKIKVTKLFLGPFALNRLLPMMDGIQSGFHDLSVDHYRLKLNDHSIDSIAWTEDEVPNVQLGIRGEIFKTSTLIPYASVIDYFIPANNFRSLEIEQIAENQKEYRYELKFKRTGTAIAVGFLIILLINFIQFSSYFSKNNQLRQEVSMNSDLITKLDSLSAELDLRKKVLNNFNIKGASKVTYYADQIAASVPISVTLDELYIFPIKKGNHDTDDILFENRKVLISGYSQASIDLNNWIKTLQTNKWVSRVSILTYNQAGEMDKGKFSIEIELL